MNQLATKEEIAEGLNLLSEWQTLEVDGQQRISRELKFDNFAQALAFTNKIGDLAEQNNHHPLIITEWGKITVQWWSHEAGGITPTDLQMAAKTDHLMI